MSERMKFDFTFADPQMPPNPIPEDDTPMRILVLGNFSGGNDPLSTQRPLPLRQRPMVRIDIDNFDDVLLRLAPRLRLIRNQAATAIEELEFTSLDDFRPENLVDRLKTFRQLHDLRLQLLNPATFAQAAAELRQNLLAQSAVSELPEDEYTSPPIDSTDDGASVLDRLLGNPSTSAPRPATKKSADQSRSGIQHIIEQAVAPYIVPKADPRQADYLSAIDKALGDEMRAILHAPSFQRLEATWRSLRKLISTIDDDTQVQIQLLDVADEELLNEVPTDDQQLSQWSLFHRLTHDLVENPQAVPWSLIVCDHRFTATPNEIGLLSALAATAQSLQAPLIAAADSGLVGSPSLIDCPDPDEWQTLEPETFQRWQSLRRSSAARWVGLALPRVLLRMPYGPETDEVETFAFEEFWPERRHEDYLWGNPAYLCAGLIIQTFESEGWSMRLQSQVDIDDLPAHTYSDSGELKLQPCAEAAFGEQTADAILQRGLMPLLSWRDRSAVRFLQFQSIADPLATLSGPWS